MKKILHLLALVTITMGFSSCCSMFGINSGAAGYRTETKQVKTCSHDIIREEIRTTSPDGKSGIVEIVERKVPRYKTVSRKVKIPCTPGFRYYCPQKSCHGTATESYLKSSTAQGPVGSPNIGLVPSMKKLAE